MCGQPDCSILLQSPSQSEAFHGAQFDSWDTVAGTVRNWIEQGAPRYSRIYFEADISQAQGGVLSTLGCVNGCHQAAGNNDSGSSALRAGKPAIFVGNDQDVWLNLTGRDNANGAIPLVWIKAVTIRICRSSVPMSRCARRFLRRMYDGHQNGAITNLEDDFPPLSQDDADGSRFPHLVKVLRWISEGAPLSADTL